MEKVGLYELLDGGLYFGELNENGLPHSERATCTWSNGRSYVGSWINGSMSGIGTMYEGGQIIHYGCWWKGELLHEFPQTNDNDSIDEPILPQNKHGITALLIGNNDYADSPLSNCINDVRAIGGKLKCMGIDVEIVENASKSKMIDAIKSLTAKDKIYKHVLFYFSGHGITNQGRHYLTAIDEEQSNLPPLSMELIDEALSSTDFENIILVSDACCNIVGGDGNQEPARNGGKTIMAFSTMLGQSSWDGIPGSHSPYAYGLLEYIDKKMDVVELLREVNRFACAYTYQVLKNVQMPVLLIPALFPSDFYLS